MVKLTLSLKDGKSYNREIEGTPYLGKKIGDEVEGSEVGLEGYSFVVTGGSDSSGVPMRNGIAGTLRKKILIGKGVGFNGKSRKKKVQHGIRRRKTVRGSVIGEKTSQINLKVLKEGKESLEKKKDVKEETKVNES